MSKNAIKENVPHIAVVGAGAVGCYFGGMLARSGRPVTLIGRGPNVEAIIQNGLLVSSGRSQQRVRVSASVDMSAVAGAELVLFCVKATDTEPAAAELANHITPQTVVISLQNGVNNVSRIYSASSIAALPSVVYVSAAMRAPGHVSQTGEARIVIGIPRSHPVHPSYREEVVTRLAQTFAGAGIICSISSNIDGELWLKLMWNCASNAVTALGRASYGRVANSPMARETILAAAKEVIEVAEAEGIVLPKFELNDEAIRKMHDAGDLTSSTAQDIQRGKKTEIDVLNGFVVDQGKELGVPTPVNQTLYALTKLLEQSAVSAPNK